MRVVGTRLETSGAETELSLQSQREEFELHMVSIRQSLRGHPYTGMTQSVLRRLIWHSELEEGMTEAKNLLL